MTFFALRNTILLSDTPNSHYGHMQLPRNQSHCKRRDDSLMKIQIDRTYGGLVGGFEVTCVAEVGNDIVHVSLTMPISDSIPEAARAARDIGPG